MVGASKFVGSLTDPAFHMGSNSECAGRISAQGLEEHHHQPTCHRKAQGSAMGRHAQSWSKNNFFKFKHVSGSS